MSKKPTKQPKPVDSLKKVSKPAPQSTHGGKRDGAGRPQGSKNKTTLAKEAYKAELESRVMANLDRLINAQLDLAVGEKFLMVKRTRGKGKNRKTWTEIVTDPNLIKEYVDDDGVSLNQNGDGEVEDFYFMTTKPANNHALQNLLDRTFGKAPLSMDLTSDGEKIGVTISATQSEQLLRARAGRRNP